MLTLPHCKYYLIYILKHTLQRMIPWKTALKVNHDIPKTKEAHKAMLHSCETKQMKAHLPEYNRRHEDRPMFKWACMYMERVETLLQLIRATRCGFWHLHLVSQERVCLFFFSQNRLKYVNTRVHYKDVQLDENWSRGVSVFLRRKL